MIVIDTSVWVDAIRHPGGATSRTLQALIDADEAALALPVRLELMTALPLLVPTEETWRLIESWIPRAADKGQRFGLGDLFVGGLTAEVGGLVWSLDDDFARMERLGLVTCYA